MKLGSLIFDGNLESVLKFDLRCQAEATGEHGYQAELAIEAIHLLLRLFK
jgi:hypothetical protein